MTWHDYRQSSLERMTGIRIGDIDMDVERLRVPLAIVACTFLIAGIVWFLETQRLTGLDQQLATLRARIDAARQSDEQVAKLARSVQSLRDMRAAIVTSRNRTIVLTNAIARLGDRLPGQTWLTGVRASGTATWSIAGRSTGLDQIGTTLATIGHLDTGSTARLLSITAVGSKGRLLDFAILWEKTP